MSPVAVQSPILTLVTGTRAADVIALPQRTRDLDRQRDRATQQALSPDVAADMREAAGKALARLTRNPGTPLLAILLDLMRKAYVNGRMGELADQAVARAQADALADATLAQVVDLVAARGEKVGA